MNMLKILKETDKNNRKLFKEIKITASLLIEAEKLED